MEYSDAEVRCLVEDSYWWYSFYDKSGKAPTVADMRAKLIQDKENKKYQDKITNLENEIIFLNNKIRELENKK